MHASAPASVLRPPRTIGCDAELIQLAHAWAIGQVAAVIGEAGMGKSRMLQDFAAAHVGTVHVAARPGHSGVPLATLVRLLRALLARQPQPVELAPTTRHEIARMWPEFDADLPRPLGEGQRLVLQRAVQTRLAAQLNLAGLLVDELHFADDTSLDMLRALIEEPAGPAEIALPLRWALAYRRS